MEEWKVATLLLCCYGFLKEIRPSEPYLTDYLLGNSSGVTQDELYHEVYPVWTYSYLGFLVLVFLFTDLTRYKAVIVFEGFSYILTWILLLWGHGLTQMQVMQVAYGIATSTEVAYFTYIYAKISGEHYRLVTSWTRASLLLGRFLSGTISQVLICTCWTDYRGLNYVSLIMVSCATCVSFLLPSVQSAIYFHRQPEPELLEPVLLEEELGATRTNFSPSIRQKWTRAGTLISKDFLSAFTSPYILKWSIWWALAMCGNYQVGNYIQTLWNEIKPEEGGTECPCHLNGGVEAATTLVGALLSLLLSFVHIHWSLVGEACLAVLSVLDAGILYLMATTPNIWTAYVGYLLFRSLYQMMITVASFEIASNISQDSYGLVFGINTFLALAFQTILTTVVVDKVGFQLEPRDQFLVYSGFFLAVGIPFFISSLVTLFNGGLAKIRREGIWLKKAESLGPRPEPPVGSTECPQ